MTTLQRLDAVRDQAQDQIARGDTKATTLLTVVGITAAFLITLATLPLTLSAKVLVWAALVPVGTSVLLLLGVVRPRLSDEPAVGTWLWAARVGPATLLQTLEHIDDATATMSAAQDVRHLAGLALGKHTTIRAAVTFLIVGVLLAATALVAWAVTA